MDPINPTATIAYWNVRTVYQMGKTQQLISVREMCRYKVDICGISEMQIDKFGKINLTTGDTMHGVFKS